MRAKSKPKPLVLSVKNSIKGTTLVVGVLEQQRFAENSKKYIIFINLMLFSNFA